MSVVNGFQVGSDTLKYNYESLENYNTPEFSASSTYNVGDYVMHEGKLYRCTTEITTAAAWDSSKWTAAVLANDVRDNSADCDGLVDHLIEVTDVEPTSDYNQIWIPETLPSGVQVPTYTEFTALEDRVDDVEEAVASVETSTTASKAYAVGDYFWKDDVLYVVTAAIASGGTITVNTNCKAAVLGNDVSDLKSAINLIDNGYSVITFTTQNNKYINSTGGYSSAAGWLASDHIPVVPGELIYFDNPTSATTDNAFYDNTDAFITGSRFRIAVGTGVSLKVPDNAYYMAISQEKTKFFTSVYRRSIVEKTLDKALQPILEDVKDLMQAVNITEDNTNLFDYQTVPTVSTLTDSDNEVVNSTATKSVYIPIEENRIVHVTTSPKSNRFVIATFTNEPVVGTIANRVIKLTDVYPATNVYTLITEPNDKYIYITFFNSNSASEITEAQAKEAISVVYGTAEGNAYTDRLHTPNISSMLMQNDQMVNLLCHRQLGTLKQGYVCLSSDDGNEQLALYTLPTLEAYATTYQKPIPLTMGLADYPSSPFDVFVDPSLLAVVVEALDDYNCSIGTHGVIKFANYTREEFYNYLLKQHENIHTITGHYPSSVLYVSDGVNNSVKMVAGSFYGVCGSIPTATGGSVDKWGNNNRANMYAMKRFSLLSVLINDTDIENAVDYALAHNEILCPYWHDINFGTAETGVVSGATAKARFEHFIEYCMSKNVDFINFGDIPTLEVNV